MVVHNVSRHYATQTMDKYKIIKELGRGTYGIVFLAERRVPWPASSDVGPSSVPSRKRPLELEDAAAVPSSDTTVPPPPTSSSSTLVLSEASPPPPHPAPAAPTSLVAIKRIKSRPLKPSETPDPPQGVNMSALREVKLLRELCGRPNQPPPHVLLLLDAFVDDGGDGGGDVSAVYEYCPTDLRNVISPATNFRAIPTGDVKSHLLATLTALSFLHSRNILHRDLAPSNLLFTPTGVLKVGDFGLARLLAPAGVEMSFEAITQWYRPPEMLLFEQIYTASVDVWSVGCIFAELLLRRPIFETKVENALMQLQKVFTVLGPPTASNWPDYGALSGVVRGVRFDVIDVSALGGGGGKAASYGDDVLERLLPGEAADAVDCLKCMLALDPKRRWSAKRLVEEHPYFKNEPRPTAVEKLRIPALNKN